MPVNLPDKLPAVEILKKENIFVMDDLRAATQDIRPLKILILNLMPLKITTETDLIRLLSNSPLQVEIEFLGLSSHTPKNTPIEHLMSFYTSFTKVKNRYFDGMIITGAPVEHLEFEAVDYWDELCRIMEWSKTNVTSTFHICWAAQAALYYHHGIGKYELGGKLFGVYPHRIEHRRSMLMRGFDDNFMVPQSRYTTIRREDILQVPELKILASAEKGGIYALATKLGRQIYITGHSEYDADTLKLEYQRDKQAGRNTAIPENYFPDDDDTKEPSVTWRSHANLLFSNWLNYYVYQTTPYDISTIT